jgi:hypothetical protein
MDAQILVVITAMLIVGMAWYSNSSKRNKIYCTFRRVNKTKIAKLVRMTSRFVIFDGGKYDVIPSCITFEWWDKGLIGMLFPQWVATLDFTSGYRYPHDPNTLKPIIVSAEVRKAMNKEEWVKSYAKGFTPPSSKKQGMIQSYLPFIAIFGLVLLAFWAYTNFQGISHTLAAIQNTLKAITK